MKLFLPFLIFIIIFISACTGGLGGSGGGGSTIEFKENIYTGRDGVKIEESKTCPSEIEENSDFVCQFKIINKGPYPVSGVFAATVNIFDFQFIQGDKDLFIQHFSLDGKEVLQEYDDFIPIDIPISVQDITNVDDQEIYTTRSFFRCR